MTSHFAHPVLAFCVQHRIAAELFTLHGKHDLSEYLKLTKTALAGMLRTGPEAYVAICFEAEIIACIIHIIPIL